MFYGCETLLIKDDEVETKDENDWLKHVDDFEVEDRVAVDRPRKTIYEALKKREQ